MAVLDTRLLLPLIICFSYTLPLLLAFIEKETAIFISFLSGFFIVSFVVFSTYFLFYNKKVRFLYSNLALRIYFMWLVAGIIYAIPVILYEFQNEADFSIINSFFTVFLALTTTGSSYIVEKYSHSQTMLFWFALIQWIGGGLTITSFLLLYYARKRNTVFSELLLFFRWYIVVTLFVIITFLLMKLAPVEALILSFSSISLGSIVPTQEGLLEFYGIKIAALFFFYIILFSLPFFILLVNITQNKSLHVEVKNFYYLSRISLLLFIVIILFSIIHTMNTQYGDIHIIVAEITNLISLSTTSGVKIVNISTTENSLYISVVFLIVVIGAHQGSSGGGVRIGNMRILKNMIVTEIYRVCHPHNRIFYEHEKSHDYSFAFANFFGFILLIFFGALLISFEGESFFSSIMLSLGYLANTDNMLFFTMTEPLTHFVSYHALTKSALIAIMIIGRLEIVVFMVYFTKYYWREKYV